MYEFHIHKQQHANKWGGMKKSVKVCNKQQPAKRDTIQGKNADKK